MVIHSHRQSLGFGLPHVDCITSLGWKIKPDTAKWEVVMKVSSSTFTTDWQTRRPAYFTLVSWFLVYPIPEPSFSKRQAYATRAFRKPNGSNS